MILKELCKKLNDFADEKYYKLAKKIGLKAETKEEGINSLIEKIKKF